MSTRYVWGRYDLGQSEQVISATSTETELPPCLSCDKVDHVSTSGQNFNLYLKTRGYQSGEIIVYANTEYTFDAAKKKYVIPTTGNYQSIRRPLNSGSDAEIWSPTSIAVAPESGEEPVAIYITIGERESSQMYMIKLNALQMSRDVYWSCYFVGGDHVGVSFTSTPPDLPYEDYLSPKGFSYFSVGKGSLVSDVSGTSQSTYPSDGVQGSYWYTYQGSDNIDPSACSIPASIMGGTAINITVTPGTGKVYGGTVSYQYQVKLGSGAWTTIATTSATSRSYTVPYGTASIQVRVRAKDNIGFTSSTYVTSSRVNVINNQPPTAPGSIDVTNVVAGQQATITLTAATDPDGTIASYVYERSVDGSAWQQIANVNSLTQTDTISADWGTVAYRAKAVDDDGASGPYVTSSTTVVNSGWVIISGPAADMGNKPAPFDFEFSVSVTGQTSVDAISVVATLDGESIYTGTPNSGAEVSIPIDTRLLAAGAHTIEVNATKENYLEANGSYAFDVPAITLPDGGKAEQLQNPGGDVVFPYTLARLVIGKDGKDVNELLESLLALPLAKIETGSYTGTGTYGAGKPITLTFEFEPLIVIVQGNLNTTGNVAGRTAVFVRPQTKCLSIGADTIRILTATWNEVTLSWYETSGGAYQLNASDQPYSYVAIG